MFEPQMTEPTDEFTLLKVIAEIRQKTGIGDKVMLADLAGVLAGLIQNGESAIETNKQLVKKLKKAEESLEEGVDLVFYLGEKLPSWSDDTPLGGIEERFENLSDWALNWMGFQGEGLKPSLRPFLLTPDHPNHMLG